MSTPELLIFMSCPMGYYVLHVLLYNSHTSQMFKNRFLNKCLNTRRLDEKNEIFKNIKP